MKRFMTVTAALVLGVSGFAMTSFYNVFLTTYNVDKASALGEQSCLICHMSKKGGKEFNAYGKDVRATMKEMGLKKVTADVLHKVENLDSTKTGTTNLEKIKAGKNPGID